MKWNGFGRSNLSFIFSATVFVVALGAAIWPTDSQSQMMPFGFWKAVSSSGPASDSWVTSTFSLAPRSSHVTVWTGSTMIIWGGKDDSTSTALTSGGIYDPATDSWSLVSTASAPAGTCEGSGAWSGTEFIVWGGSTDCSGGTPNVGGKYNPATNTWTAMSMTGAPTSRWQHTTVWTGSKMLIWGGMNTAGGAYDPSTNSWALMTTTGAPAAGRSRHSAIWTGSKMIVWGGTLFSGGARTNTGGQYDPATDTWSATTTTGAPAARELHTAVWTGTRMIIWGGESSSARLNTGAQYDPSGNSWSATTTTGAPGVRKLHGAVWTGTRMIVWGGKDGITDYNDGFSYDPTGNSWTAISTTGTPASREGFSIVWTGTEMLIWTGYDSSYGYNPNNGARYKPSTDTWSSINFTQSGSPMHREGIVAAWTGTQLLVWGGCEMDMMTFAVVCGTVGGIYNPGSDSWSPMTTTGGPTPMYGMTGAWGGNKLVVWGGLDVVSFTPSNTGSRYDPATDTWAAMTTTGAPSGRYTHSITGIGTKVIVWGGTDGAYVNTGAQYDPTADSWSTMATASAPAGRGTHGHFWTGTVLFVWGGSNGSSDFNTGGRYNPTANTWAAVTTTGAPSARTGVVGVWTGSRVLIWGGSDSSATKFNTGAQYNPTGNSWSTITTTGAPTGRLGHSIVWTGTRMIVWGGNDSGNTNTGGRYDPTGNSWQTTTTTGAATARYGHVGVWLGTKMLVWGGTDDNGKSTGQNFYYP